jgi:hypothetical protein
MEFFVNQNFFEQEKRQFDATLKDEFGPINVPGKQQFWMILANGSMFILRSRRAILENIVEEINIKDIEKNWSSADGKVHPTLEDFPDVPDQFCFQFRYKENKISDQDMVVICNTTLDHKKRWMNLLEGVSFV